VGPGRRSWHVTRHACLCGLGCAREVVGRTGHRVLRASWAEWKKIWRRFAFPFLFLFHFISI
jgi:hypothetical protein